MGTRRTTNTAVMPGLDPPAPPKPLRRGEGPGIHPSSKMVGRGKSGHDDNSQPKVQHRGNIKCK